MTFIKNLSSQHETSNFFYDLWGTGRASPNAKDFLESGVNIKNKNYFLIDNASNNVFSGLIIDRITEFTKFLCEISRILTFICVEGKVCNFGEI